MYVLKNLIVFIVLALFTESKVSDCSVAEIPQIKVTRIEVPYINLNYTDLLKFKLIKHNATYNSIHIDWEATRDLPVDAVMHINVYVTNSKYEDDKLILRERIPVCKESPKRQLLPADLVLPKSRLQQCVKKGKYSKDNLGNFRFELTIPNIHEISDYHYVRYELKSKDEVLTEVKFFSEWGYLNN